MENIKYVHLMRHEVLWGTVTYIVAFIVFLSSQQTKQNLENSWKLTERGENHKTSQLPSKICDRFLNSLKILSRSWLPRSKNNLSALSPISYGFYNSLRCQPWSTESLNLAAEEGCRRMWRRASVEDKTGRKNVWNVLSRISEIQMLNMCFLLPPCSFWCRSGKSRKQEDK